jgi:chromosome segregation ATPase
MSILGLGSKSLAERDKTIKELQDKITILEADATNLEQQIAGRDERIRELEASQQASGERYVKLIESYNQARDTIKQLKADAEEHAVASARYVEEVKRLQSVIDTVHAEHDRLIHDHEEAVTANSELGQENDELLAFVRSLHKGDFRSNRHGPERYEEAVALLSKYDKASSVLPLLDFDGINLCSVCGKNASSQCKGCKCLFCGEHFLEHTQDNAKFLKEHAE